MALVLNGEDQYLSEVFSRNINAATTYAIKFKLNALSSNQCPVGGFNTDSTANGGVYCFYHFDVPEPGIRGRHQAISSNLTPTVELSVDVWHSAVLVNDGSQVLLYIDDLAPVTVGYSSSTFLLDGIFIGAAQTFGNNNPPNNFLGGKAAYYRRASLALNATDVAAYNAATSEAEINAVLPDGANLINGATVSGSASALTAVGSPTYDTEDPLAASGPAITNINTNNEFTPGEANTLNGTNLSETGGSIVIDGETQTITSRTATAITFTGVRGGNPYNTDLTLTYTDADSNTATQTVQQVPEPNTFAVTAASPNTTDDASLWSGLVDTSTGDPVTVVDGDQALVTDPNSLGSLAVTPAGEISADTEGEFVVQFWRASEGVWGSDQTVSFEVPAEAEDNWPFGKEITPSIPVTWTWGSRHPKTGMRVRIFK